MEIEIETVHLSESEDKKLRALIGGKKSEILGGLIDTLAEMAYNRASNNERCRFVLSYVNYMDRAMLRDNASFDEAEQSYFDDVIVPMGTRKQLFFIGFKQYSKGQHPLQWAIQFVSDDIVKAAQRIVLTLWAADYNIPRYCNRAIQAEYRCDRKRATQFAVAFGYAVRLSSIAHSSLVSTEEDVREAYRRNPNRF